MKIWCARVQILRKLAGSGEMKFASELTYTDKNFQNLSVKIQKAMQVYERDMYETTVIYSYLDENSRKLW